MYPGGIHQLQMVGTPGFKHIDPATDGPIIGREIALLGLMDPSQVLEAGVSTFQIWNRILELYSSCLLTNRQDKLVAISALAKHFAPILDDEYIAGLWRRHLPQHLLWKVKNPCKFAPSHSSSESYCAPSWSWASYNGEIRPYSELVPHEKPVMIDILEVKIMTETSDPTGQVSAGYIKILGWLKRFSSLKLADKDSDTEDSASESDIEVAWELKSKGCSSCDVFLDQAPMPEDRDWYCLPIIDQTLLVGQKDVLREVNGLILLPTKQKDEFRRVGTFKAFCATKSSRRPFNMPTYPFRPVKNPRNGDPMSVASRLGNDKSTKSAEITQGASTGETGEIKSAWWRFRKRRNAWREYVITII
jgi:hypothetical protein